MSASGSRRRTAVTVAGVVLFATACGAGAQTEGADATGGDPQATADARRGAALYGTHCARCHGDDLRGTDLGPPHLDAVYAPSHHADAAFRLAIARGVAQHHWDFGPMPPVEGLTPTEVEDVIAFVREQQRAAGIG